MKTPPPDPAETAEINPREAAEWLAGDEPPLLIDCREPSEHDICRIDGSELVPLNFFAAQAPLRINDAAQPVIVYCHHGIRSMRAVHWLRGKGFRQAFSMRGGIEAWALDVDPSLARY